MPAENLLGADGGGPLRVRDAGAASRRSSRSISALAAPPTRPRSITRKLRVQGGRPIVEHQAIGTKLADIAIKLEVARTVIWQAAWASDHPDAYADGSLPDLPLQTIAQVFTSQMMLEAAKDAAEVLRRHGRDARHAAAEIRA